ncbi:PREDICTED: plasmolipin [Gavialis gangeticus]|uniref:plasmolipin n=1 Tax=Gavialis gangeticus TaxID=94835 RepID=UPI00092F371D|nr:PREDICTED: plasmolipin [Gavialis gangeticus]
MHSAITYCLPGAWAGKQLGQYLRTGFCFHYQWQIYQKELQRCLCYLALNYFPLLIPQVFGLLVWALIADTYYQVYAAYGWVMFISVFFWLVTVILFVMYLLQLHLKLYMIPWPLVLVIFNAAATLLYITAFITCSASVKQTSVFVWEYNRRAAASFFACVMMIAYGASTFLSYQAWKGVGSNAATSQVTNHA